MTLREKITGDMQAAMKKGATLRKTTLRMLLSELKYAQAAMDAPQELDDASAMKIILRYQKRLEKSLEDYPEGDHREKIRQELGLRSI